MDMVVLEVSSEAVVLDANHPLAGRAVTFDVRVLSVAGS
jgi:FKBP-type peptidyl-prolyl cis-trans isomerase 2